MEKAARISSPWPMFILLPIVLVYPLVLALDVNTAVALGQEDGMIENLGAAAYFVAALFCLLAFLQSKIASNRFLGFRTARNIYLLLLAIFFFICGGEEISWGQRIFGWETPARWQDLNAQRETNFHNLWRFQATNPDGSMKSQIELFLYPGRLMLLFWASYCIVVPVLYAGSSRARSLFAWAGLPIPPLSLAPLFIASYLSAKLFKEYFATDALILTLSELQESSYAVLFALLAMMMYLGMRQDQLR